MLTADVARMAIQAATAALLLSHTARIWELIVLQAFAGTGTAFFNPASTGLTPMTVSAERLQEANALRGMSMASMQFVGPALAGILIVTVGPGYALAIDAASFGVSPDLSSGLMAGAEGRLAPFAATILASGYDNGPAAGPGSRGCHRPRVLLPGSQGRFSLVRVLAEARRCAATLP